jgi:glycosyltransferase involved in cell wall biosynthesis
MYACREFQATPHWMILFNSKMDIFYRDNFRNITYMNYYHPESVNGSHGRNVALELVKTKYIYFQDDDNLFHPEMFNTVIPAMESTGKNIVMCQNRGGGVYLKAAPENMRPCHVDISQIFLKMETIGEERFLHNGLHDGIMYQTLFQKHPDDFFFSPHACCWYNHF